MAATHCTRQTDLPRHRHSSRLLSVSSTVSVGSGDGQQGAQHGISGILSHHLRSKKRRWTRGRQQSLTVNTIQHPTGTQPLPRDLINQDLQLSFSGGRAGRVQDSAKDICGTVQGGPAK